MRNAIGYGMRVNLPVEDDASVTSGRQTRYWSMKTALSGLTELRIGVVGERQRRFRVLLQFGKGVVDRSLQAVDVAPEVVVQRRAFQVAPQALDQVQLRAVAR